MDTSSAVAGTKSFGLHFHDGANDVDQPRLGSEDATLTTMLSFFGTGAWLVDPPPPVAPVRPVNSVVAIAETPRWLVGWMALVADYPASLGERERAEAIVQDLAEGPAQDRSAHRLIARMRDEDALAEWGEKLEWVLAEG